MIKMNQTIFSRIIMRDGYSHTEWVKKTTWQFLFIPVLITETIIERS